MSDINYTFGVLSNAESALRHTTVGANTTQAKLLDPLWHKAKDKGDLAEVLIRFLRCSESWPQYCEDFDKLNTYHIPVALKDPNILFKDLAEWADSCPDASADFKTHQTQPTVDRITNKLFGVLVCK